MLYNYLIQILTHVLCMQTTDIIRHRRAVALKGLQFFLRENDPIVKTCQVNQHFRHQGKHIPHCQLEIFLNVHLLMCSNLER